MNPFRLIHTLLFLCIAAISSRAQFTLDIRPVSPGTGELKFTLEPDFYYQVEGSYSLTSPFAPMSGWMLGDGSEVTWPIHYPASASSGSGSPAPLASAETFSVYPFANGKTLVTWDGFTAVPSAVLIEDDYTFLPPLLTRPATATTGSLTLLLGALAWDPAYAFLNLASLSPAQRDVLEHFTTRRAEIIAASAPGSGPAAVLLDSEKHFFRLRRMPTDFDGDGLSFFEELAYHTDYQNNDSDGDTIPDGEEVAGCTSPTSADTDEDGHSDSAERDAGTDPNNQASFPVGLSFTTRWVFYSHTQISLSPGAPWRSSTIANADWDAEPPAYEEQASAIPLDQLNDWLGTELSFPTSPPTGAGLPSFPPIPFFWAEGLASTWPAVEETETEMSSQARLSQCRFWLTTQFPAPVSITRLLIKRTAHSIDDSPVAHAFQVIPITLPAGTTYSAPVSLTPGFSITGGGGTHSEWVQMDLSLLTVEIQARGGKINPQGASPPGAASPTTKRPIDLRFAARPVFIGRPATCVAIATRDQLAAQLGYFRKRSTASRLPPKDARLRAAEYFFQKKSHRTQKAQIPREWIVSRCGCRAGVFQKQSNKHSP